MNVNVYRNYHDIVVALLYRNTKKSISWHQGKKQSKPWAAVTQLLLPSEPVL